MSQSRIPSPARSQGAANKSRRHQLRKTRSVGSPASSTASVKMSSIIQPHGKNLDSSYLSPLPTRRSVLTDDTDIGEETRRRSWWKKLGNNSTDILEVLNENRMLETNEAMEEYIDIELIRPENRNYTLALPESSDNETIDSIVIPQRKLFTQKENQPQNKFGQFVGTRESLANLHKTTDYDITVNVAPKNLFNKGSKAKQVFPKELLNISSNKTANKTRDIAAAELKGQVRSLFGNRAGTKRKNMFSDFIASESEDEISEIQPKIFEFQRRSQSVTPNITTDIEMDEWNLLPSSTMVENQLENTMATAITSVKKARLSKISDKESGTIQTTNISINKTKLSNNKDMLLNSSKPVKHNTKETHMPDQYQESNDEDPLDSNKDSKEDNQLIYEENIQEFSSNEQEKIQSQEEQEMSPCEQEESLDEQLVYKENIQEFSSNDQERIQSQEEQEISPCEQEESSDEQLVYKENIQEFSSNEQKKIQSQEEQEISLCEQEESSDEQSVYEENIQEFSSNEQEKIQSQEEQEISTCEQEESSDEQLVYEEAIQEFSSNEQENIQSQEEQEISTCEQEESSDEQLNLEETIQELSSYEQEKIQSQEEQEISPCEQEESHGDQETIQEEQVESSDEQENFKVKSPEAVRNYKTKQMESFVAKGCNTSLRRASIMKNMNMNSLGGAELAPPRESTGLSDGTRNSSAGGSGWDSHRTTRKTLRQTFGKDFSPRKSLRTLVMEKSVNRQTTISDLTSVTGKVPLANSTELPDASNIEKDEPIATGTNQDISTRTRQTTIEMYLQKIKKANLEWKMKMEEEFRNSLKAPRKDNTNPFKIPARPPFATQKPKPKQVQSKPKAKRTKSTLISFEDLPPELKEDMKYKPPKRFKPRNASWITKRLYKFVETKLEPKYDYRARVRAEKLMETIYHFTKEVHRQEVASSDSVNVLKHEMARLDIVKTHFDFYHFFGEYMPREIRIKVVPDIVNKIPVPREGIFSDILRGTTV